MGLKTINYEVKKLGITLPEAYALIKKMHIENGSGYAEIVIQSSRENALKLDPIQTVRIEFTNLERTENPYKAIYDKVKGQRAVERIDWKTKEKTTVFYPEPFYGWEDDIVDSLTY